MQIRTLILISLLLSFGATAQLDSAVYLKPVLKKGTLVNFKLRNALVTEVDGQGKFSNDGYYVQLEVLKSAYGLSILKMKYNAFGGDYQPGSKLKLKDDLSVLFTIDSNQRFVAIENPRMIVDTLNQRLGIEEKLDPEKAGIEPFFPEIELLFFLNGAKYEKGEVYQSESLIPIAGALVSCNLKFEMTSFNRQENRFEIKCQIDPKEKEENLNDFEYNMKYTFRLSDLLPVEIESKQVYKKGKTTYHVQTTITKN